MKTQRTLIAAALTLASMAACSDPSQYCFGEPSANAYNDVVVCFALSDHNTFNFDGTETWQISGFGWNRVGGFAPITGAVMTGIDQDGTPAFFISYSANLVQKAQHDPHGVAMYDVKGAMIIPQRTLAMVAPGDARRFDPSYVMGASYREDIMVNASLFGMPCAATPWTCWDLQDGKTPIPVVRYALDGLPFTKPQTGGY